MCIRDSMGNVPRCSYQDKLKILSQSKISVVHGLWRSLSAEGHMQFPRASENLAFSHLDEGIGPQVKSRMFEAAFSRCVILCQRDYWNPIELWFEPEKEFMYFDNEKDLDEKINYIIKIWFLNNTSYFNFVNSISWWFIKQLYRLVLVRKSRAIKLKTPKLYFWNCLANSIHSYGCSELSSS